MARPTAAVWTALDGTSIDLSSGEYALAVGTAGLDAPPVGLTTAARLSASGSARVGSRFPEREMLWMFQLTNLDSTLETVRTLAAGLVQGGRLAVTIDGQTRELRDVQYRAGLEGVWNNSVGIAGQTSRRMSAVMVALDPWWYEDGSTASLTLTGATAFDAVLAFDDASTLFDGSAASPVSVSGHAGAYPITTVTGPFDTLQVGLAGGQTWELTAALAAGSVITVDTRPGNRGPRLNGGAVDWSLLTEASRLFELPVGPSTLVAQSTGSTGASSVEVAWDERYLTP